MFAMTSPRSAYTVSLSMSMATSVSSCGVQGKYVYDYQFLLDIHDKDFCYEENWLGELNQLSVFGLLHPVDPKETTALPGAVLERKY